MDADLELTAGLDANRAELDTLLRYAQADGMTDGRLAAEALFHPSLQASPV